METTILHSDLSVEWMSAQKEVKMPFVTKTTKGSLSFAPFLKINAHCQN